MKIAIATDNGETTIRRHFGDAGQYDVYDVGSDGFNFLKSIKNCTDVEEETHADPEKADNIVKILKKDGINIAAAQVFGPNLKRIKSKFVCIIVNDMVITEALKKIQDNMDEVIQEWDKGEERDYLRFTDKSEKY